jgi:hypothetical protein
MYDYQVMRKAKETEIHPYNFAYDADHPTRILICFSNILFIWNYFF